MCYRHARRFPPPAFSETREVLAKPVVDRPIACLDAAGRPVAPREPNGYKLERRALETCTRRWLSASGLRLPPDSVALELDHSVIDGPEDAASLSVRVAAAAGSVIRMGPGVTP